MSVAPTVDKHAMRRSTRVRWQMPVQISSLDPQVAFREQCQTLVVNTHGCGVRSPRAIPIGSRVRLETADHRQVNGAVADCAAIGQDGKAWLLGIALETAGNFWRIPNPPADWESDATSTESAPAAIQNRSSSSQKLSIWPSAQGSHASHHGSQATATKPALSPMITGGETQNATAAETPAIRREAPEDVAGRVQRDWEEMRRDAEAQLRTALERVQRQQLEEQRRHWEEQREGVEARIQQLLELRDEVRSTLDSITGSIRESAGPVQHELMAAVRREVESLTRELQARATEASAEEQSRREAAERAIAAQIEQAQQARTFLNALVEDLPKTIDGQIQKQAGNLIERLTSRSSAELTARMQSAMRELDRHIELKLEEASTSWQQKALEELEGRHSEMVKLVTSRVGQVSATELELRESARQLSVEVANRSEEAMAELRAHADELTSKYQREMEARFQTRNQAAETALHALGGKLLASLQNTLQADMRRQQQEATVAQEAMKSELEKLLGQARHLESELRQAQHARESVEATARKLPSVIEQQVREAVGSAVEDARERLNNQANNGARHEIEELDNRVAELAKRVDAEFRQRWQLATEQTTQEMAAQFDSSMQLLQSETARLREQLIQFSAGLERQRQSLVQTGNTTAEQVRARENELRQVADRLSSDLQAKAERSAEALASKLSGMLAGQQQTWDQMLAAREQELQASLQQYVNQTGTALRQQVQRSFDEQQAKLEQIQVNALANLESLESRTEQVAAVVDAELQKSSENLLKETVAEAAARVRAEAEKVRQAEVVRARAELDNILGLVVQQATEASSQLRGVLESLRSEVEKGQAVTADARQQAQSIQRLVERETEQFQKKVHEVFLQSAAEIRGRVSQAVEMAEEPLVRRSRELEARMQKVAEQTAQELQHEVEEVRSRLHAAYAQSETEAGKALERKVTQALHSFQEDAERLAQIASQRWHAAINETLKAIPQLLAGNLQNGPQK